MERAPAWTPAQQLRQPAPLHTSPCTLHHAPGRTRLPWAPEVYFEGCALLSSHPLGWLAPPRTWWLIGRACLDELHELLHAECVLAPQALIRPVPGAPHVAPAPVHALRSTGYVRCGCACPGAVAASPGTLCPPVRPHARLCACCSSDLVTRRAGCLSRWRPHCTLPEALRPLSAARCCLAPPSWWQPCSLPPKARARRSVKRTGRPLPRPRPIMAPPLPPLLRPNHGTRKPPESGMAWPPQPRLSGLPAGAQQPLRTALLCTYCVRQE